MDEQAQQPDRQLSTDPRALQIREGEWVSIDLWWQFRYDRFRDRWDVYQVHCAARENPAGFNTLDQAIIWALGERP